MSCGSSTAGARSWRRRFRLTGSSSPTRITRELRAALNGMAWDVVVQWIGSQPEHITDDLETFAEAGQYVFISSAVRV